MSIKNSAAVVNQAQALVDPVTGRLGRYGTNLLNSFRDRLPIAYAENATAGAISVQSSTPTLVIGNFPVEFPLRDDFLVVVIYTCEVYAALTGGAENDYNVTITIGQTSVGSKAGKNYSLWAPPNGSDSEGITSVCGIDILEPSDLNLSIAVDGKISFFLTGEQPTSLLTKMTTLQLVNTRVRILVI